MDMIFGRPIVIVIAILGAIAATLASVLQARNVIGPARAKQLNVAGYACMGLSILLFIVAGFKTGS